MIEIRSLDSTEPLSGLKQQYMARTTAALDGMWLTGFVPAATHFGFFDGEALVGFGCVDCDGHALQFMLEPSHQDRSARVLDAFVAETSATGGVRGAFASTAEPEWLSLCLDRFGPCEVHTLMYQLRDSVPESAPRGVAELKAVRVEQLPEAVDFAATAIGAPKEWLTGYFGNLVTRGELFGVREAGRLRATGECRGYDEHQTAYADLGVIVAEDARSQGLATAVLRRLVVESQRRGLRAICSTEKSNVAAQKAIRRAGFFAGHRIVRFET